MRVDATAKAGTLEKIVRISFILDYLYADSAYCD